MVLSEYLRDKTLIRHWSSNNLILLQVETGIEYEEAVDVVPCRYTYIETDKEIPEI